MELRQASPLVEGPDTSELISLGGENADGDDRQNQAFHSSHLKGGRLLFPNRTYEMRSLIAILMLP